VGFSKRMLGTGFDLLLLDGDRDGGVGKYGCVIVSYGISWGVRLLTAMSFSLCSGVNKL